MSKPTKLPWRTSRIGSAIKILSSTGYVIASIDDVLPYSAQVKKQNAQLIVGAVNSVDELRDALQDLVIEFANMARDDANNQCGWDPDTSFAYVNAKKILSKVPA